MSAYNRLPLLQDQTAWLDKGEETIENIQMALEPIWKEHNAYQWALVLLHRHCMLSDEHIMLHSQRTHSGTRSSARRAELADLHASHYHYQDGCMKPYEYSSESTPVLQGDFEIAVATFLERQQLTEHFGLSYIGRHRDGLWLETQTDSCYSTCIKLFSGAIQPYHTVTEWCLVDSRAHFSAFMICDDREPAHKVD